jgi:hypothetical protein
MSSEEKRAPEEYELLYLYGFHEVKGLEGVWQRGRAGVDVSVDPKMYSSDEALELIKEERSEQEGAL